MPRDVEIAKELVRLVKEQDFNTPINCFFTHDEFNENERVDEISIRVATESLDRERNSRGGKYWIRNATISFIMLAPQQANTNAVVDAEQEIDRLLDLLDAITDFIEQASPLGKRLSDIEPINEQRYDKSKLQNDRQFRAGYLLLYRNIGT